MAQGASGQSSEEFWLRRYSLHGQHLVTPLNVVGVPPIFSVADAFDIEDPRTESCGVHEVLTV